MADRELVPCQHCAKLISPRRLPNGCYVDEDGFMVCKKRIGDEPFLTHQPMPAVTGGRDDHVP